MKVYIIQATARHNELDGKSQFIHKRAFASRSDAEAFAPLFAQEIADDKTGIATYCDLKTWVNELELVSDLEPDSG